MARKTHVRDDGPLPIDLTKVIHMHPRWIIPMHPNFWFRVAQEAREAAVFAKKQLARKRAAREEDLRVQ